MTKETRIGRGTCGALAAALTLAVCLAAQGAAKPRPLTPELVAPEAAKKLMGKWSRKKRPTLIDVRTRQQYETKHIPGAYSLPYADVGRLQLEKDDHLILYCWGVGCRLSEHAAKRLLKMGYTRAKVLEGGMKAWMASGFKTESGSGRELALAPKETPPRPEMMGSKPLLPVSWEALKARIDSEKEPVLVDSRPPSEYAAGHLPGALSMPLEKMDALLEDFKPAGEVVVYDRQARRSRRARWLIAGRVLVPVRELAGGITAWSMKGYQLEVGCSDPKGGPESGCAGAETEAAIEAEAEAEKDEVKTETRE
ncbi:MAG: rhodanese-like domain-containing protein [Elusimicrobiota bacterium]